MLGTRISSFFSALWPTLPLDLNDGKTLGWRNGQWFEKTSSGHDGMTIVFNGSQRSIVNKPLSRSSLHKYLCVHHPHHGGHERVRQEMDGCVAATQEYPGTTPPKTSRHYPSKNIQALSTQNISQPRARVARSIWWLVTSISNGRYTEKTTQSEKDVAIVLPKEMAMFMKSTMTMLLKS